MRLYDDTPYFIYKLTTVLCVYVVCLYQKIRKFSTNTLHDYIKHCRDSRFLCVFVWGVC
ncbi:hypothetical protein HMPREF1576_00637 [Gardnerella pickettii JCP7719]|uniref:Uncharacterized protein n=1 Tax=Gardnerella pickettii JCP7719 TaxID=1261061 RepID=S4GMS6_9BIFI|nr:hypothetical protein HMPREF1576_00637 [Gardnerella pickettii JCP7719]